MPGAKRQIGNRGGRRKGAGRKRKLTLSDRRKIASDYHARMQKIREGNIGRRSRAGGAARTSFDELMAKYGVTHRMIVRCLEEFLPENQTEQKNLEVRNGGGRDTAASGTRKRIEKLKPGIYTDKKLSLRLIVNSAGNRKWFFRFRPWSSPKSSVIVDKILGGSELSLATARELAAAWIDNPSAPDRGARTLRPVVELEEPAPSRQPPPQWEGPPVVIPVLLGPELAGTFVDKLPRRREIQLTCDACSTGRFHVTLRYRNGERAAKADELRAIARKVGWTSAGGDRCPRCSPAIAE